MKFLSDLYFYFLNKSSKKIIYIPKFVKKIPTGAITNNKNIEVIHIHDDIKIIEQEAFYNCSSLKAVYFHGYVTSVDKESFFECKNVNFLFSKKINVVNKKKMSSILNQKKTETKNIKNLKNYDNESYISTDLPITDKTLIINELTNHTNENNETINPESEAIYLDDNISIFDEPQNDTIDVICSVQSNDAPTFNVDLDEFAELVLSNKNNVVSVQTESDNEQILNEKTNHSEFAYINHDFSFF